MPPSTDPRASLERVFGFPEFRPGQREVIDRLLAGRSVLAIFPTGGGKSLCYQLPALLLDGLTLVVSPLIALMKDQVEFLTRHGVPAARLDSSLTMSEAHQALDDLRAGRLKLLYLSPERLASERFLMTASRLKVSLLAVDESHCISEWGHNFRPDYLKLGELAKRLKVGRVLALTATATPAVARDIAQAFGVADGDTVRTGFYRPNLTLKFTPCTPDERPGLLVHRLTQGQPGATIVYVTLQRTAEEVAGLLASHGVAAKAYHAGMKSEERSAVQDWFMAEPAAVVVATIAFGMGIDKADIRAVYHYNLPKSLENYAQEIGRAGRDGEPSHCEVFACAGDRITLENFIYGDTPTVESVAAVVSEALKQSGEFDVSAYDLSGEYDIRPLVLETLLTYLDLEGVIEATQSFFAEYKYQWLTSAESTYARFDPARADFLRRMFAEARFGKLWFTIDVTAAARATGEPRERLVKALNYLAEQGDLLLQPSGSRQGYRRRPGQADARKLTELLHRRFQEREGRDLARLRHVLDLAAHPGCKTRHLLDYFGDDLPADCGHCGWCLGERPGPIPPAPARPLDRGVTAVVRALYREGHAALATPRQAARLLCGINSPAAQRAKLNRDKRFGVLADSPFGEVLALTERVWGGSG
jgi:ATP-dependent DNA helicase RecQ